MRAVILLCVLALTLASFGCAGSTVTATSKLEVPDPELVPYSYIPHPIPKTLYRILGGELVCQA